MFNQWFILLCQISNIQAYVPASLWFCRELESAECNVYNHGWLIKQMSPVHSWPISIKSSQWMMRTRQPTLSSAMFPLLPLFRDIQHTAEWQPVWVGLACKHRWLHIYEQGAQNYRNSNNFISQSNLVINAVACNREILDLKFSAHRTLYTLRPIIGFSDMAALNFPPFQSVKSDIGCW